MFGVGVGIRVGGRTAVSSGGGFDPDAQAFFDRVTTAGGTLTTTEKNATNQLVLDMKSAGIWSAMKAVYPMVGASAAACAQNLKSSSFTGSFSSGWTFASTGVKGNGASTFFNTNFIPSAQLTLTSGSYSLYSRTNINETTIDMAVLSTTGQIHQIITRLQNTQYFYYRNSNVNINIPSADSLGHYILNRNSSTNTLGFKNGVGIWNQAETAGLPSETMYLGARNESGSAVIPASREYAFASIGDGLTDTQASNFYTAVQTFNTTLNRSVGTPIVSDADAQAYIDRVYTAGGTLTNTEANAVNQLTIDMKAAGIWTAMKAVYPMVGSSAAACAQNLKSSSFTGTFSSGWTFASTGVTPNGTSAYMDTAFNPNSNLSISSASLSVYTRTTTIAANLYPVDLGCDIPGTGFNVSQKMSASPQYHGRIFVEILDGVDGNNIAGLQLISRNSTTSLKYYRNGTLVQTNSTLEVGPIPNINAYLGALNNNGTPFIFSDREYAFASLSDGLNDTQAASFYTCVQTFNTTLSRQV